MNHCDEAPDIEASVDQTFGLKTALDIPDINPNNRHVRFR